MYAKGRGRNLQTRALIDGDFIFNYMTTFSILKHNFRDDISAVTLYIAKESDFSEFYPFYQTAQFANGVLSFPFNDD